MGCSPFLIDEPTTWVGWQRFSNHMDALRERERQTETETERGDRQTDRRREIRVSSVEIFKRGGKCSPFMSGRQARRCQTKKEKRKKDPPPTKKNWKKKKRTNEEGYVGVGWVWTEKEFKVWKIGLSVPCSLALINHLSSFFKKIYGFILVYFLIFSTCRIFCRSRL